MPDARKMLEEEMEKEEVVEVEVEIELEEEGEHVATREEGEEGHGDMSLTVASIASTFGNVRK